MSTLAGATAIEPARPAPAHLPSSESQDTELTRRIRAEFLEMPGLRLTANQAARVFGVDAAHAVRLMDALIEEGMLIRDSGGVYRPAGSGQRGVQRPCIVCRR